MKTFWRRLLNVIKTPSRCLKGIFGRYLKDILTTSWKRFQDVLKKLWRRYENVWARGVYSSRSRRLNDILKKSSEDIWRRRIYSSLSRRLEVSFKTSSKDEDETSLKDIFKTSLLRRMFTWVVWRVDQIEKKKFIEN